MINTKVPVATRKAVAIATRDAITHFKPIFASGIRDSDMSDDDKEFQTALAFMHLAMVGDGKHGHGSKVMLAMGKAYARSIGEDFDTTSGNQMLGFWAHFADALDLSCVEGGSN